MATDVLPRRFWEQVKIVPGGCWDWTGALNNKGYGLFNIGGKTHHPHRLILQHIGREIPKGMYACHSCDRRMCCNPSHVFIGTPSENFRDMVNKGRCNAPKGQRHWQSKYTPDQIHEIRRLHRGGMSAHAIGKLVGCGGGYVWQVLHGKLWAHLPEELEAAA